MGAAGTASRWAHHRAKPQVLEIREFVSRYTKLYSKEIDTIIAGQRPYGMNARLGKTALLELLTREQNITS